MFNISINLLIRNFDLLHFLLQEHLH